MSRKKSFPFPSGDLLLACIQPRPLRGGVFGFRRFGSPRISAAMPTPVDHFQVMFHVSVGARRHSVTKLRKPMCWLPVPTIILCEARGLWLFWVIRGGIGLTRRLGAECSTRRLMSEWILSLEPEHRRTDWPPTRYECLGEQLEFCATLKLLASSVVRRRSVPPFSKVSKQWPRSSGLTSDVPSPASCLCPAKPHRSRATAPPHSWLGSRLL